MDAIRQRQIQEVLNGDQEINKIVFQIEKQNAGLTTENVLPYTQLNTEVLEGASAIIGQLLVLLEKKRADVQSMLNTPHSAKHDELFHSITSFEEILRLYNTAVEPYNGIKQNLTQQTKSELLNKVRKIISPIAYITNGLNTLRKIYRNGCKPPEAQPE